MGVSVYAYFLSYLFLYAKVHVVGPYGYDGAYGYGAYGYGAYGCDLTFVIDFFFWADENGEPETYKWGATDKSIPDSNVWAGLSPDSGYADEK